MSGVREGALNGIPAGWNCPLIPQSLPNRATLAQRRMLWVGILRLVFRVECLARFLPVLNPNQEA